MTPTTMMMRAKDLGIGLSELEDHQGLAGPSFTRSRSERPVSVGPPVAEEGLSFFRFLLGEDIAHASGA